MKRNASEAFDNSISPSDIAVLYSNGRFGQRVDPMEEEGRHGTVWSDAEKCIFLDRFLHHPKDFRTIASIENLRRKSVKDCIKYYYDYKKTVPYKQALKEFRQWKKSPDVVFFDATVQSLLAVGAIAKDEDNPKKFILPEIDRSNHTRSFFCMRLAVINSPTSTAKVQTDLKGGSRKTRASMRNARGEAKNVS